MANVEEGEISEGGQLKSTSSEKKISKPALRPESLELLREPLKVPRGQSDKPKPAPRESSTTQASATSTWKSSPPTRTPSVAARPSRSISISRDDSVYRASTSEPYPPTYYRDSRDANWIDPLPAARYDELETRERELHRSARPYDYYSYDDLHPPPASSYDYDRYTTRSPAPSSKSGLPLSRGYSTGSMDLYDYDYGYTGTRSEGWADYPYYGSHSYSRDYDLAGVRSTSVLPERVHSIDYDYSQPDRISRTTSSARDSLGPPREGSLPREATPLSREHGYSKDPSSVRSEGITPRDIKEKSPARSTPRETKERSPPRLTQKLPLKPSSAVPKLQPPVASSVASTSSAPTASVTKPIAHAAVASPPRPVAMKRSISNDEYVPPKKLIKPNVPLASTTTPVIIETASSSVWHPGSSAKSGILNTAKPDTSSNSNPPASTTAPPRPLSGYSKLNEPHSSHKLHETLEQKSPQVSLNSASASFSSAHTPPPPAAIVKEEIKNDKPKPLLKVFSDEITKPKDIIPAKPIGITSGNPAGPVSGISDRLKLFERKNDTSNPNKNVQAPKPSVPNLNIATNETIIYTLPTAQLENKTPVADSGVKNTFFSSNVERHELSRSLSTASEEGLTIQVPAVSTAPPLQPLQRRPRASWGKGLIIQPTKVDEPSKPLEPVVEEKPSQDVEVREISSDAKEEVEDAVKADDGTIMEEEVPNENDEEERPQDVAEEVDEELELRAKRGKRSRAALTAEDEEMVAASPVVVNHDASEIAEISQVTEDIEPQRKKRGRPFNTSKKFDEEGTLSPRAQIPNSPKPVKEEVIVQPAQNARDTSPVPGSVGGRASGPGRGRGGRGRGGGRWAHRHLLQQQQREAAAASGEDGSEKKTSVSQSSSTVPASATSVSMIAGKKTSSKEKKQATVERLYLGNIFSKETDIHRAYNTMAYILELQKTQISDTSNQKMIHHLALISNLFQGIKTVQAASKLTIPRTSEICYALDLVDQNLEMYYTLLGNQRAKQYLTEMSIRELDKLSQQVVSKVTKLPPATKDSDDQGKRKDKGKTLISRSTSNDMAEKSLSPSYLHRYSKNLLGRPATAAPAPTPATATVPVVTTSALSTAARSILNMKKRNAGNHSLLDPNLKEKLQEIQRNNQMRIVEAHLFTTVVNQGIPMIQGNPAKLREIPVESSENLSSTASTAATGGVPPVTLDDRLKAGEMNLINAANAIIQGQVILPLISETVQEYISGNKSVYQDPKELLSYQITNKIMQRNRHIITKEIRQRKLARRQAWEQLSDAYLAIQHKWTNHISQIEKEEDEIANREGPKLRGSIPTSSSMRSTASATDLDMARYHSRSFSALRGSTGTNNSLTGGTGGALSAGSSAASLLVGGNAEPGAFAATRSQATNYLGLNVARSEYEQDRLISELTAQEVRQRRIELGMCTIPEMISPWCSYADVTKPPRIPKWPEELRQFELYTDNKDPSSSSSSPEPSLSFNYDAFPKCKIDRNEVIDTNSLRLTTDGKRQHCASLPFTTPCPPECNCAVQVERYQLLQRCWTDLEKAIFIDKFLQYPKNFHKIATFLTNRSTKDCIQFYYDSKSTIEFKLLLKEFDNRRKLGRSNWNYSVKAAHMIGAALYPTTVSSIGTNGTTGAVGGTSAATGGGGGGNTENGGGGVGNKREALVELPTNDNTFLAFTLQPPHIGKTFNIPVSNLFHKGNLENEDGRTVITQSYPRAETIRQSIRKRMDDFVAEEVDNNPVIEDSFMNVEDASPVIEPVEGERNLRRSSVHHQSSATNPTTTTTGGNGRRQLFRDTDDVLRVLRSKQDYGGAATVTLEELKEQKDQPDEEDDEDEEYDAIDCKVDELLLDSEMIQSFPDSSSSTAGGNPGAAATATATALPGNLKPLLKEPFNKKFSYFQNKKFIDHLISSYRYTGGLYKRAFYHDLNFGITNTYRETGNSSALTGVNAITAAGAIYAGQNIPGRQNQGQIGVPGTGSVRNEEMLELQQALLKQKHAAAVAAAGGGGPGASGGRKGRGEGGRQGRGARKTNSSTALLEMMSAAGEGIHLETAGTVGRPPLPSGRGSGRSGRGRGRGGRGGANLTAAASAALQLKYRTSAIQNVANAELKKHSSAEKQDSSQPKESPLTVDDGEKRSVDNEHIEHDDDEMNLASESHDADRDSENENESEKVEGSNLEEEEEGTLDPNEGQADQNNDDESTADEREDSLKLGLQQEHDHNDVDQEEEERDGESDADDNDDRDRSLTSNNPNEEDASKEDDETLSREERDQEGHDIDHDDEMEVDDGFAQSSVAEEEEEEPQQEQDDEEESEQEEDREIDDSPLPPPPSPPVLTNSLAIEVIAKESEGEQENDDDEGEDL